MSLPKLNKQPVKPTSPVGGYLLDSRKCSLRRSACFWEVKNVTCFNVAGTMTKDVSLRDDPDQHH